MPQAVGQILSPQHFGRRNNGQSQLEAGEIDDISNDAARNHDQHAVAFMKSQTGKPSGKPVGLAEQLAIGDFLEVSVLMKPFKRNLIRRMLFHFRSQIVDFRCNEALIVQMYLSYIIVMVATNV
ncbi:hypothetical protein D3C74_434740 [compost metagenome]